MKRILGLLLVCVLLCVPAWAEETILKVRGTGVVSVTADVARVVLGVQENAATVQEAQATVNAKVNAIYEALYAAGVAKKDIETDRIHLSALYDYNSDEVRITGYTASNSIAITTTQIGTIGNLIDTAFSSGANTLDYIDFETRENEEAQREALELAVKSAYDKAQIIAEAANMRITGVISFNEAGTESVSGDLGAIYSNSRKAEGAAADEATLVSASTLKIQATIVAEFALEGK